eukprot:COSAG01_NODE_69840_length_260_cov_0.645963_1_plen_78_part_01
MGENTVGKSLSARRRRPCLLLPVRCCTAPDMGDCGAGDAVVDSAQFLTQDWVEQPVSYLKRDLLTYALGIGCTELRFT